MKKWGKGGEGGEQRAVGKPGNELELGGQGMEKKSSGRAGLVYLSTRGGDEMPEVKKDGEWRKVLDSIRGGHRTS